MSSRYTVGLDIESARLLFLGRAVFSHIYTSSSQKMCTCFCWSMLQRCDIIISTRVKIYDGNMLYETDLKKKKQSQENSNNDYRMRINL